MANKDIVACWEVPMADKVHKVEFEHGTTSGKRVVYVDNKEIFRQDWMFKLVGKEHFNINDAKCTISIEAVSGFAYEYTLDINGKSLKKFHENQAKVQQAWLCYCKGEKVRICLDKHTLDVYVNGKKADILNNFGTDFDSDDDEEGESGPGIDFYINVGDSEPISAKIKTFSSGNKRKGIMHKLFVNGNFVPEVKECSQFC